MDTMGMIQGARRVNRSGGLVQLSGDLGLLAAFCFWAWVLWGFVQPTFTTPNNTLTIESAITGGFLAAFALVLALCCAVVMPALCAAIFPHTSAAMYLHEIRRSAWGFWLLALACAALALFSAAILANWWAARLAQGDPAGGARPADAWLVYALTCMTLIFFVVVPSWAANYGTPVLWLTEVQQAHQVERLRMTHRQNIALAKASYRRALNILKAGLDSATAEQREYTAGVLIGLHRAEHALMLEIAGTLDEEARIERTLPAYDDPAIVRRYDDLRQLIVAGTPVLREQPAVAAEPAPELPEPTPGPRPGAAQRGTPPRYAEEYQAAFARLQPFVTAKSLAELLQVEERTAREVLSAWEAQGWIAKGNIRGQWAWSQGGA